MRSLIALLLLLPSIAFAQPMAVIDAPSMVNIGDLVIIDGGKSVGDNHLWVVDERAQGRYYEVPSARTMVFAIGTPGKYSIQLIVADTSAGISQAVHFIQVGGIVEPPPIADPKPPIDEPKPPLPEPEPPHTAISEVSRRGVIALNDPPTAGALKDALAQVVESPPTTIDRQRSAVQDAIGSVLLSRQGVSREKDWLNEWRIPVNAEIDKTVNDDNYIALIKQVITGFDGVSRSPIASPQPTPDEPKPSPSSITMYTREGCRYCDEWKAIEMPRVKSQGWAVDQVADLTNAVPYFDICINGRCIRHQGYLSMAALKSIVEGSTQ
jgi:hypothetical protein